ncbi:hypothetical protein [Streptomyces longisporoflavus]|uniref:hypothetical protein n=1 Tax=Streptomyces longisporoflavus TaxID=28044 RepID=UPI00167CBCC5|nr:hypothetical protein [Streptomyces longisporoflavus]
MNSGTSAVHMGEWVYTPADAAGGAKATLHDQYQSVDLRYSAALLEDFLAELGRIEATFASSASASSVFDPSAFGPRGRGTRSGGLRRQISYV